MFEDIINAIKNKKPGKFDYDGKHAINISNAIQKEDFETKHSKHQPSFSKPSLDGVIIVKNDMEIEIVTGDFLGQFTMVSVSHHIADSDGNPGK